MVVPSQPCRDLQSRAELSTTPSHKPSCSNPWVPYYRKPSTARPVPPPPPYASPTASDVALHHQQLTGWYSEFCMKSRTSSRSRVAPSGVGTTCSSCAGGGCRSCRSTAACRSASSTAEAAPPPPPPLVPDASDASVPVKGMSASDAGRPLAPVAWGASEWWAVPAAAGAALAAVEGGEAPRSLGLGAPAVRAVAACADDVVACAPLATRSRTSSDGSLRCVAGDAELNPQVERSELTLDTNESSEEKPWTREALFWQPARERKCCTSSLLIVRSSPAYEQDGM